MASSSNGVVGVEAAEGPGDRVAQASGGRRPRAARAVEQVERAVEPGVEVADREGADAARRQLDREWQPVEPAGDVGDGAASRRRAQVGPRRRAVPEGVDRGRARVIAGALFGHQQRADAHEVLGG